MTDPTPKLREIVAHIEELLQHGAVDDMPQAVNGLQVENSGRVTRLGAAVDACEATLRMAAERNIDLLLVHHGLFWNGVQPVTGAVYRKLKLALGADIAVFSSHLPLDRHPELGNNALLAKALGLSDLQPFFAYHGQTIGFQGQLAVEREELAANFGKIVGGEVKLVPGGPQRTARIGVVSGASGSDALTQAVEGGLDTLVSGEGSHGSALLAEELGLNVLYGGHYATETQGVRALAAHLAERYNVPWEFLEHPTGL